MPRRARCALLLILLATPVAAGAQASGGAREMRLAVEPVLERSGLLERLLPAFEAAHGVRVVVRVLAAKDALELGASGGTDLVWVSAPRAQVQYLNQGFYLDRRLVVSTDHVLVGPPGDPARVRGSPDTATAFRRIGQKKAAYVSCRAPMASYAVEQEIWKRTRLTPTPPWYVRVESGHDAVVLAADRGGYTLVDRSTAQPLIDQGRLQIVLANMQPLRRGFHVMEVNPNRFPGANYRDAKALADYLVSPAAQEIIHGLAASRPGTPDLLPGAGPRAPHS